MSSFKFPYNPHMTWQLAVSSWSWHEAYYAGRWSLLDLPDGARQAGLTLIEANDFMLPPPRFSRIRKPLFNLLPGVPPELWRYSRRSLVQLKGNAAASQTRLLCWTINSNLAVSGWAWPLQQVYLRWGIAAARHLQAPLLRLNLGGQPSTPAEMDDRIVARLVQAVHLGQRRYPGLTLTVENHWGLSTDIDRHLRLVAQARAQLPESLQSRLGCCFDPGNMPEGDREQWWRGLSAAANHFHFKTTEFDERGRDPYLPHDHILALLRSTNYWGDVTIEFQGDGDPIQGIQHSFNLFHHALGGQE